MIRSKAKFLALAAPILAILVVAAYALVISGPYAFVAAFALLILAGLLVGFSLLAFMPGRRVLGEVPDARGVGLSNSRVITGVLLGLVAASYLLVLGLAIMWIGTGDRPTAAAGPLVFLAIVAVAGLPGTYAIIRGKFRLGGLLLTPDEIVYRSYATRHSMSWQNVIAVEPKSGTAAVLIVGETDEIKVPYGLLRTDPQALVSVLGHYREHARDRDELADGRALVRHFDRA